MINFCILNLFKTCNNSLQNQIIFEITNLLLLNIRYKTHVLFIIDLSNCSAHKHVQTKDVDI